MQDLVTLKQVLELEIKNQVKSNNSLEETFKLISERYEQIKDDSNNPYRHAFSKEKDLLQKSITKGKEILNEMQLQLIELSEVKSKQFQKQRV